MEDIQSLTDKELVSKLKEHGQQTGPITASTRILFEQKLHRCLDPSSPAPLAESEDIIPVSTKPSSTSEEEFRKKPVTESAAKESVFYGVQLAPGAIPGQDRLLVFSDKQEALRQLKLYPGSRFKPFNNKQEAENFSRGLSDPSTRSSPKPFMIHTQMNSGPSPNKQVPVESSAFRTVKTQDLVKLRKLIEKGDVFEARNLIWSNPRYLISSGDTPTVLQEGFRYNALHVAAMKNQPESTQLILDTIENPQFMQLLYPGEPEQTRDSRMQFLVDLYLNTPDKGLGESALHFACKFGHADVVKILATHPKTERNRKNKYGETPADLICSRSRQPAGSELKSKIKELLQDHYYVHLWRSEDNSTPPHVAEPWSPTADVTPAVASPGNLASPLTPAINRTTIPGSPRESPVSVKAVAGPMSASQAKRFRKTWLTPPCSSPQERKHIADVKRKDSDKGLERIGRHVAHTMGIPWAEYWDFLGCYADFSTDEGLEKLEIYLRERCNCLQRQQILENDLNMVSDKLNQLNLSSPGYQSRGVTGKPVIGLGGGGGDTLILYLDKNVLADEHGGGDVGYAKTECGSNDKITQASHPLSPTDGSDKNTEDNKKADLVVNMNRDFWHAHDIPLIDDSDSDNGSDSFHTAFDQAESDVESLFTPPESPPSEQEAPKYFIYGSEPSKIDLDVVRSLEQANVDENRYPCITEWRKHVKSYKEEDASRWGTPHHIRAAAQYRITASANNTPYSPLLMSYSPGVLSQSFSPSPASSGSESSLDSISTIRVNLMSSFQTEKHIL